MGETEKLLICGGAGLVLTALLGLVVVPALRAAKVGQAIKADGPVWHMGKQGTPTMGGIMFIAAALCVSLAWGLWQKDWTAMVVFGFASVFGVIGFVDDFAKLRHHENTGLSAPAKFLLQLSAAILFTVVLQNLGHLKPDLVLPFVGAEHPLHLLRPVYLVFAALVMVGTVNAVNLTDGVDGLSSCVTMPVMLTFAVLASQTDNKQGYGAFAACLLGCLVGFFLYNHHPAKVFMGDTGSLFLGGAVCGLAFALDMPLILIFVGIVYILETLSDILQVFYFKLTKRRTGKGKRIFLMAPLHHHFEQKGWSEGKVVAVFATLSCLGCALGYLGFCNYMR